MMKENVNTDDGRLKSIGASLGLRQDRFVIEGESVKDNVDSILKLVEVYDDEHTMKWYPKTGKIVGAFATSKLSLIKKDLSGIDKNIKMHIKAQTLRSIG